MIPDERERNLPSDERRHLRQAKLESTNKLLYKEVSEILKFENIDWLKCWQEFSNKNLESLESERKMWIEIMDRGSNLSELSKSQKGSYPNRES